jgi:hypothetical protein
VVLAQLGQALHGAFLGGEAALVEALGLEPVMVVGQVDQRVRSGLVEQLGQAGPVPAAFRRARGEEADVFLGTLAHQRLTQGITPTQQQQPHSHSSERDPRD